MLTEEQIRKEAEKRYPNHYTEYNEGRAYVGFVRGANFALSQSQWISVEDRLPEDI